MLENKNLSEDIKEIVKDMQEISESKGILYKLMIGQAVTNSKEVNK